MTRARIDPPNWEALREKLLTEGWLSHEENGMSGVRSPHDAIFIGPEELAQGRFSGFVESLARHVSTATDKFGDTEDVEVLNALTDMRRLLALLTGGE